MIQGLFVLQYKELSATSNAFSKKNIQEKEFHIFSQSGEDGILVYIFSCIKTTNRTFVEIGAGNGKVCNTAVLSKLFGWNGLLIDALRHNTAIAKKYYHSYPVIPVNAFVTRENINAILLENNIKGSIDLLTIDIDGNDYWIWDAISVIDPHVVMIEYNASFGEQSISIPYEERFERYKKHKFGWYHGASLIALEKLAHSKGYELAGCSSSGVNTFFVKKEIISQSALPILSAKEAYCPHRSRSTQYSTEEQFDEIKNMPFEKI